MLLIFSAVSSLGAEGPVSGATGTVLGTMWTGTRLPNIADREGCVIIFTRARNSTATKATFFSHLAVSTGFRGVAPVVRTTYADRELKP